LVPMYMKKYYKDENIFEDTKIVTSIYNDTFEGGLTENMFDKVAYDGFDKADLDKLKEPTFVNLMKNAIDYSDAVFVGSENIGSDLTEYIESSKKPFIPFLPKEKRSEGYLEFYKKEVL